jgi:hypothetical protein
MISLVNKSQSQTPPRRDERAVLRAAHVARVEAREALEAHKSALSRARVLIERAEKKLDKTKSGIEEAKLESARMQAKAIAAGREADTNGLLRAARHAEVVASDELESRQAAYTALRSETRDREFEIERANVNVAIAARELAVPFIRDAIVRLSQLEIERAKLQGLVRLIGEGDGFRLRLTETSSMEEVKLGERLDKVFGDLSSNRHITDATDTLKPWQEALARLREDPDAPLPSGA